MSEVGGEAEVLVTFANDVIDPQADARGDLSENAFCAPLVVANRGACDSLFPAKEARRQIN